MVGAPPTQVGSGRIRAAVLLLGVLTVETAVFVAFTLAGLLVDTNAVVARLPDAGIGWPAGTALAVAGAALHLAAVWRGRAPVSVPLLLAAGAVWTLAGAWIIATGGNSSVLVFGATDLALTGTVAWARPAVA